MSRTIATLHLRSLHAPPLRPLQPLRPPQYLRPLTTLPPHRNMSSPRGPGGSFPATFARGGTSNGLVVLAHHLPPRAQWATVLPAAMGSPDPAHGRQLDGLGGGVSSTSKVCVLTAPRGDGDGDGVDVEFTFVQVGVRDGRLDLAGNCGNMLAAVGPVALAEGLVGRGCVVPGDGEGLGGGEGTAVVRILNTNTGKTIEARFRVQGDPPRLCARGDYAMAGVPGTAARITLRFLDPGGAKTGKALPTGRAVDRLELPGGAAVEASLVDVGNPGVFVRVRDLGVRGGAAVALDPAAVEADWALMARLEAVRRAGAVRMGLDPEVQSVPKVVMLFDEADAPEGVDIRCLALSMGQAHKAVPLTLALCLGAASKMKGTLAWQMARPGRGYGEVEGRKTVVIGHPSGRLDVGTTMGSDGSVRSAELHRTARILMRGEVFY